MKNYFRNRPEKSIKEQLRSLQKLLTFFRKECDIWAYIMYGTLLGSIRNNNVIPHDTDYDISIFIPGNSYDEVSENFVKICEVLYKNKMLCKVWTHDGTFLNPKPEQCKNPKGQLHVKTPDQKLAIDMWLSWSINNKLYLHPFIYGSMEMSELVPFKFGYIQDEKFIVPNKPEAFLEKIYGEDWRIPKNKKPKIKRYTMGKNE